MTLAIQGRVVMDEVNAGTGEALAEKCKAALVTM